MKTIEIITAGNELLLGDVLDTNTNWLCKHISLYGGKVRRAVIVPDELSAITRELQDALRRGAEIIFTIGGLGPTPDDRTLQAVAAATGSPLKLHPQALAFVQQKYEELATRGWVAKASLTKWREKMAMLPQGADFLPNPCGAAPAPLMRSGKSIIISLPGVPAELKGIVEESLQPLLRELLGRSARIETSITVNCNDESALAPLLKEVVEHNPEVYIKPHPLRFGSDVKIRITLSSSGESPSVLHKKIAQALNHLKELLSVAGLSAESAE